MNEGLNLNEAQLKWLCKKQNEIIDYIENHYPLDDKQWESVVGFVDKAYEDSKQNKEVLKGLHEVTETYDRLANCENLYKHGCITKEKYQELKAWEKELISKNRKD